MKMKLFILTMLCLVGSLAGSAQSLRYSRTIVATQASGLLTVPPNKTWKIENAMSAPGSITVSGAISNHCGSSCSGGSCGESSCRYRGFLYTINGIGFNEVFGCFVCSGSSCTSSTASCPSSHTFNSSATVSVVTPFWLATNHTVQINATNVMMSILEFDIVP